MSTLERPTRTLKARYVFPVDGEPIDGGVVEIVGEHIARVGRRSQAAPVEDLGNVALLPGLVNAHAHLELSDCTSPLGKPGMPLPDWIRLVVENRRTSRYNTEGGTRRGLAECTRQGVTLVGDIVQPGWSESPYAASPQQAVVLLELLGLRPEEQPQLTAMAESHVTRGHEKNTHTTMGLCPHAPYSVSPSLFENVCLRFAGPSTPVAMHIAESREELELLATQQGPFRELLEDLGAWREQPFRTPRRPLDLLRVLARSPRGLAIHGNYLTAAEIEWLGSKGTSMSVVYCPRTHAYFQHHDYPLPAMLAAGVNIALGTDSRASNPDLSLLAEMRFICRTHPGIAPWDILRMGTANGARALGQDQHMGTLSPGKWANFAVVALDDAAHRDPYEGVLHSDLPVVQTWFRGQCAFDPRSN